MVAGTFLATCWSRQCGRQGWNIPLSQFTPRCLAQGGAEHQAGNGQVRRTHGKNPANTSCLTPQIAPHTTHRPQESKHILINQASVSLSVRGRVGRAGRECHPLLEQIPKFKKKIFFFKQQGDICRCFTWPKIRRISNEFPQGIVGDFWLQKVFLLLL